MNNSRNKYKLKEDLVGYKNKYFDKIIFFYIVKKTFRT